MKVIPFSPEIHYEEVCRWWKHHEWPNVPLYHLSDTGFMVVSDALEVPICAGWLYFTGTAFSIFEFAVVNPTAERKLRQEALNKLIDFAQQMATRGGAKTVFTSTQTKNRAWVARLARGGFTVTDLNMTNLVARVGG